MSLSAIKLSRYLNKKLNYLNKEYLDITIITVIREVVLNKYICDDNYILARI